MDRPVAARTCANTSAPLAASRIAEVAKAINSVTPMSSAKSWLSRMKAISSSTSPVSMTPSGPMCWARRNCTLRLDAGMGAAP